MNGLYRILNPLRNLTRSKRGFTLIELVIAVAIIGILTAIAIPSYGAFQTASKESAAKTDLVTLRQAIDLARAEKNTSLFKITGSGCTRCVFPADPLSVPKGTAGWTAYNATLKKISDASGMNVNGLVDPQGRPYQIDENEDENGKCTGDVLGAYKPDFSAGVVMQIVIPPYTARCNP